MADKTAVAKKQRDEAAANVKAGLDARAKQNEVAMKRMESTTPTPTQEENDLARAGVLVDDKKPDGSGPVIITRTVVANEPLAAGGYTTRAVAAADKAALEAAEKEHQAATGGSAAKK